MENQVYSLKWNNYIPNIMSSLRSLMMDKDLVDVTLSCEGKRISVHKVMLSACSSYFRSVLKENPAQHPVIIFRNVSYDDLQAIINFIYNGEVSVDQNQLSSFLHTAELLEIKGLTNESYNSKTAAYKTVPRKAEVPVACTNKEPVAAKEQTPEKPAPTLEGSGVSSARKKRKLSEGNSQSASEEQENEDEHTLAESVALEMDDNEQEYEFPESQAVLISDDEEGDGDPALVETGANKDEDNRVAKQPSCLSPLKGQKRNTLTVIVKGQKYLCSLCRDKSFPDLSSCKEHCNQHFSNGYVCSLCFKVFHSKSNYNRHMYGHSDQFKCSICLRQFDCMSRLKTHHLRNHIN